MNVAVKSYMYSKAYKIMVCWYMPSTFPPWGYWCRFPLRPAGDPPRSQPPGQHRTLPFPGAGTVRGGSIMVAHLHVPELDAETTARPPTLSYNTVTKLLRRAFAFRGLIFTDALDMKGVTKYLTAGRWKRRPCWREMTCCCCPKTWARHSPRSKSTFAKAKSPGNAWAKRKRKYWRINTGWASPGSNCSGG